MCTSYTSKDVCAIASGCEWNSISGTCSPGKEVCNTTVRADCETIVIETADKENGTLVGAGGQLGAGRTGAAVFYPPLQSWSNTGCPAPSAHAPPPPTPSLPTGLPVD